MTSPATAIKTYTHNLGSLPEKVQVQVQATDGANNGFIFEGVGSSQVDDVTKDRTYGGVIYTYTPAIIIVWPPDAGSMISVADGWGGGVNNQQSNTAKVRVRAWKKWCAKCYDSGSFQMSSQAATSTSFTYATVKHNYGNYPSEMSVVTTGAGFTFPAIGMAQSDDDRKNRNYGGLIFATDSTSLRFWAPTKNNNYANGNIINVQNGWPFGIFALAIADVRAIAYKDQKCGSNYYLISFFFFSLLF